MVRECGVEIMLVMVVVVMGGVVFVVNINDGVVSSKGLGIVCVEERRVVVVRKYMKYMYGECFVGVEVIVVSIDERGVGFEMFGSGFGYGDEGVFEYE